MKTANGVEKPLAEWTLKDVKETCASHGSTDINVQKRKCSVYICCECPLRDMFCLADRKPFAEIDLEEKPKFTEQEIEDAKTLMRFFGFEKTSGNLRRESDGRLVVVINRGGLRGINTYEVINSELFPSINRKEHFTFSAIIGD